MYREKPLEISKSHQIEITELASSAQKILIDKTPEMANLVQTTFKPDNNHWYGVVQRMASNFPVITSLIE